jgi:hypothetical protein
MYWVLGSTTPFGELGPAAPTSGDPLTPYFLLREHPGMRARKPPVEQSPKDDAALLTAALNHAWAWYDQYSNRAFQLINYYIVATAIVVTAYATAINGKHYPFAAALAIAGLGLTAILAGNGLYQIKTAALAEPALTEMQERIGASLRTDSMHIAGPREIQQRRNGTIIMFGVATAFYAGALLYAVIH